MWACAENILVAARYAQELAGGTEGVGLVAVGQVGIPALHAAAVEPRLFRSVKLVRTLRSWSGIASAPLTKVSQAEVVFGALLGVRLARSCRQPGHEALDRAAGERGGTARELAPLLAPKGRNTSAQGKRSAALGEEIETPEAPKGRNNGLRRRKLPSRLV